MLKYKIVSTQEGVIFSSRSVSGGDGRPRRPSLVNKHSVTHHTTFCICEDCFPVSPSIKPQPPTIWTPSCHQPQENYLPELQPQKLDATFTSQIKIFDKLLAKSLDIEAKYYILH